jgi:hypothetical protein
MIKAPAQHDNMWLAFKEEKVALLPCEGTPTPTLVFNEKPPVAVAAAGIPAPMDEDDDLDEL